MRKLPWDTCIQCNHYPDCDDVPVEECKAIKILEGEENE